MVKKHIITSKNLNLETVKTIALMHKGVNFDSCGFRLPGSGAEVLKTPDNLNARKISSA